MKLLNHSTAKASYYNTRAQYYDDFNENSSKIINSCIEKILNKYKAKTVLDLTCGTGSQVFWLAKSGFNVTGVDINATMLKIAKKKAKTENIKVKLLLGDCRNTLLGRFDSVITIFNSIGHLTKIDFEKTIKNINKNLKNGGIYIFDIFNLDYLVKGDNITKLTIDWFKNQGGNQIREVQFSTISDSGILTSYSTYIEQLNYSISAKISKAYTNTLQCYSVDELKKMLESNGFSILNQTDACGKKFYQYKSERILMIASKFRDCNE